jgi:hypothetical protein
MKMTTYLIIGGIILAISTFIACKPKTDKQKESETQNQSPKEIKLEENPFDGLRDMALGVTAEQLGLQIAEEQTKVYGIVMDWDLGDGIATVSAYETGDASMYLSSGGGVIGGGQHENVRNIVFPYITKGQSFLNKATLTDSTPLPDKNCIRFYFLTNKGKFMAQENMKNIESETSEWLILFEEANKVLSELRLISENK